MKPMSFALVLLVAAAAGAASAGAVSYLAAAPAETGPRAASPAPPVAERPVEPSEVVERLEAEVRMLGNRVAELTRELQGVRAAAERTPVVDLAAAAPAPGAQAAPAVQKEQVAAVLSQIREEEERQRDLERQERERRQLENRAGRIARELGMGPGDEARLAAFLQEASVKRDELMAQVREGGFDRESMRATFEGLRTWSTAELTRTFGPQLAEQILQQGPELGFGGPGAWMGQQQGGRRRGGQGGGQGGAGGGQGGF